MTDKKNNLRNVQTKLEELECRIMGSSPELHRIYTTLKSGLPWAGGGVDGNNSQQKLFGLSGDDLALIHRFMFAGAFESARIRTRDGQKASARKSAELHQTVQAAGYPSHEFFSNYFKYEKRFARELHRMEHPTASIYGSILCWLGILGLASIIILLAIILF